MAIQWIFAELDKSQTVGGGCEDERGEREAVCWCGVSTGCCCTYGAPGPTVGERGGHVEREGDRDEKEEDVGDHGESKPLLSGGTLEFERARRSVTAAIEEKVFEKGIVEEHSAY